MLNLSPLLNTTVDQPHLLKELDLSTAEKAFIAQAKNDVRNRLRDGIPEVMARYGYTGKSVVQPRFFTQGSWAYKTLNSPCQNPPQQSDVDDGAYLPVSVIKGTSHPSIASSVFFAVAEEALEPLVKAKGWQLLTDKDTCIRIVISKLAHIDIPLYSIPDEQFEEMSFAACSRGYETLSKAMSDSKTDTWTALPTDKVLLAHRKDNWIKSDPRPVKDWFISEVTDKGEQLRRIVRYLKAARDQHWASGGPSSILLMAAAASVFEKRKGRDDLALLDVLEQMPGVLRTGVNNPVDDDESLTDRLGEEEVEKAATRFEEMYRYLSGAIHAKEPQQACNWAINIFGKRFPNRPDLVLVASVVETITATPAEAGPRELVERTKAG